MSGPMVKDRSRSPRFPSYSLSEALSFAGRIYQGAHRALLDPDTIYQLMGFKGRSGPSATALGALRQFGLVDGSSGKTRISDLALRILEPETVEERASALNEAAQNPDVFQALLTRYDGAIPPADEPIRAYLIRELGFSKAGAEQCLSSFRATMNYMSSPSLSKSETAVPEVDEIRRHPTYIIPASTPTASSVHTREDSPSIPDFVFHLGGGLVAMIEIKGGPITSRHLDRLQRFIHLQSELLAEENSPDDWGE